MAASMPSQTEPIFFSEARNKGQIVVAETPKFDLDTYTSNYKGKTRVYRLLHIGKTSAYLYTEALKLAVAIAKAGKDVLLYQRAVELAHQIIPGETEVQSDQKWIDKTLRENKAESDRLEAELKGYKNNLIKESIRMGYDDLGRQYHQTGNLTESAKAFAKERDCCQTHAHLSIMYFRMISVYVEQENWMSVEANIHKLSSITSDAKSRAKQSAALGLAYMASKSYDAAARSFLDCDPVMLEAKLDDLSDDAAFNEILTPNDVATYGALCSLASMTRGELQARVLENARFRDFLELEPHLRRAISSFVAGKYAASLEILESYRADYLLDIYLSRHFNDMLQRVRNKAMTQYFIPYSCITFSALAGTFKCSEESIIQSLIELIAAGTLSGRLDLERQVLVASEGNSREAVNEEALNVVKNYERTLQMRMIRMSQIQAGLEVKSVKSTKELMQQAAVGGDTLMGIENSAKGKMAKGARSFFG